jgi:DNA-binding transcriptional LysR family regulator
MNLAAPNFGSFCPAWRTNSRIHRIDKSEKPRRHAVKQADFRFRHEADIPAMSGLRTDAGLLPAIMERFSHEFPRAVLHVLHEDIAIQQYDNLRNRMAELRFGRLPTTITEPDLVAETLFDESLVVVAGSESRWAERRNLTLADLIGEPWVLAQPGSLARSLHEEVFRGSGVDVPSAKVLTVSLYLQLRLIETGRWLSLIPASVMRFGSKQMHIKVLPIKVLAPPTPIGFVRVKDRTLTPLAERFVECSRKVANSNIGRTSTRGR